MGIPRFKGLEKLCCATFLSGSQLDTAGHQCSFFLGEIRLDQVTKAHYENSLSAAAHMSHVPYRAKT